LHAATTWNSRHGPQTGSWKDEENLSKERGDDYYDCFCKGLRAAASASRSHGKKGGFLYIRDQRLKKKETGKNRIQRKGSRLKKSSNWRIWWSARGRSPSKIDHPKKKRKKTSKHKREDGPANRKKGGDSLLTAEKGENGWILHSCRKVRKKGKKNAYE